MLTKNAGFHVAVECRHHMHSGTCFDLIFRRFCDCGHWISHGIPIFIEICIWGQMGSSANFIRFWFFFFHHFLWAHGEAEDAIRSEQIEILLKYLSAFFALSTIRFTNGKIQWHTQFWCHFHVGPAPIPGSTTQATQRCYKTKSNQHTHTHTLSCPDIGWILFVFFARSRISFYCCCCSYMSFRAVHFISALLRAIQNCSPIGRIGNAYVSVQVSQRSQKETSDWIRREPTAYDGQQEKCPC